MNLIFLVDGDNNIGTGLRGIDMLTPEDKVLVFYGKGQTLANLRRLCGNTRAQVQYLESVSGGKNSIDFQIITELGVLVGRGEADFAYVISQDKGYEAAMSALRARYSGNFREVALQPSIQSCLRAVFLLRASTKESLKEALRREFGPAQGGLVFGHLQELFREEPAPQAEAVQAAAVPAEPAPEAEAEAEPVVPAEPPAPPVKKRRTRRTAAAGKTPEPAQEEAVSGETAPEETTAPAEPAKKKPVRRTARRTTARTAAKKTSAPALTEGDKKVMEAVAELTADPAEPEEKPAKSASGRRRRSAAKPKAEDVKAAPAAPEVPERAETEQTDSKPARRTVRRRKKPAETGTPAS